MTTTEKNKQRQQLHLSHSDDASRVTDGKIFKSGMAFQRTTILSIVLLLLAITFFSVITVFAATTSTGVTDTTQPTVVLTLPDTNAVNMPVDGQILVRFSEAMDPSTINAHTIIVTQRTTPATGSSPIDYRSTPVSGTVSSNGVWGIFTPTDRLTPNQEFGNVYTVTVTPGVKDLAGNPLARNYVWSFTTGVFPFFADASTTQLDQTPTITSALAPIPPIVAPAPNPAPTTVPQPAPASFPWAWLIAGLLIVFIIALLIALVMGSPDEKGVTRANSTRGGNASNRKTVKVSIFGDIHPISDIIGITATQTQKLADLGIKNTKQLWEANALQVADAIKVPSQTVHSWQHMAELISIHGIGPQYAELLEQSGVHSVEQLKSYTPEKLLAMLRRKQETLDTSLQGTHIGPATVSHWIDEARAHKGSETSDSHA